MNMRLTKSDRALRAAAYLVVGLISLLCLYPLLLTLMVSLSDEYEVQVNGFSLLPKKFSLGSYKYLFTYRLDQLLNAYFITVLVTVIGTLAALFICSMVSYTLSNRAVKYRNGIALFLYFTVVFPAGMVPWYIVCVNVLHLKDTLFALIIPVIANVWNIFLLRNYFSQIPYSITESAKLDGANDFRIYSQIIMPMSKTAVLTVGLFIAVQYWNDWFLAIMFISKKTLYPMQYYLFSVLSAATAASSSQVAKTGVIAIPAQTIKMTTTMVTIFPILFLFPLIQKYFINGIIIGAIKE